MHAPFTVALVGDHYVGWVGGAGLLGALTDGLIQAARLQHARVHLLLDARRLPPAVRDSIDVCATMPAEALRLPGPLGALVEAAPMLQQVVFYRDLPAAMDRLGVDVVGPTAIDLGERFPRPWFAYIPDFQHQYLAHLFSADERRQRDAHFRAVLEHSAGVFVNSATVAADIARFYPAVAARKRVLRFPQLFPDVAGGREDRRAEVRARHGVPAPFLLSCSQRWAHKRHDLIVAGFAEHLRRQPDSPLHLVFTGETADYRDPGHAAAVDARIDQSGLRHRVHVLGLVPRADQLQLVAAAEAVVTASQFEGGPGASGVSEAALLGTPVLASDIEANRELPFGRLSFYDGRSAEALAEAIGGLAVPRDPARARPPYGPEQLGLLATAMGLQTLAALRGAVA